MYDDMLKEMKDKMAPVVEMAEINKKTAETLVSLQTEYFSDFVNSSLAQVKALTEVKEPKEAFDLQVKFFKELEGKISGTAEKEMATLTDARDQLTSLIEKSMSEIGEMPYFPDMSKFADMSKFDFSMFDMSKYMPQATKPKAAAKSTPRKSASAPAAAAS